MIFFDMDKVFARVDQYHELIAPYVVGAEGETMPYTFLSNKEDMRFESSLTNSKNGLKPHIKSRHAAVQQSLGL